MPCSRNARWSGSRLNCGLYWLEGEDRTSATASMRCCRSNSRNFSQECVEWPMVKSSSITAQRLSHKSCNDGHEIPIRGSNKEKYSQNLSNVKAVPPLA